MSAFYFTFSNDEKQIFVKQLPANAKMKKGVDKRKFEKEHTALLFAELGYQSPILYKESGQPYLELYPELHISITHSHSFVGVAIGKQSLGLDVEIYNTRIELGADYFVNENEITYKQNQHYLHIIWGAKEAFYKLKEGKIEDLRNEVTIQQINQDSIEILYNSTTHILHYMQDETVTIVYT